MIVAATNGAAIPPVEKEASGKAPGPMFREHTWALQKSIGKPGENCCRKRPGRFGCFLFSTRVVLYSPTIFSARPTHS
jgi:hypothetical protein